MTATDTVAMSNPDYGPGVNKHAESIERDPGMLTPKDRQWVYETKYGNEMYDSPQGMRKRRSDAARRIHNALLDFRVLHEADPKQFEELADRAGFGSDADEQLKRSLMANVAFLYECIRMTPNYDFESIVELGVEAALLKSPNEDDPKRLDRVNAKIEPVWKSSEDVAELARRLRDHNDDLDDEELGILVRLWRGTDWLKHELTDSDIQQLEDGEWPIGRAWDPED
ncbi:MAG: hypothetical protein V5A27_08530 [Halapricum sp.]